MAEQVAEKARIALIELNRQEPPAQHALYQHDDPDADYYDGPCCVTCETRGPKWCDEHGPLLIPAEPSASPKPTTPTPTERESAEETNHG